MYFEGIGVEQSYEKAVEWIAQGGRARASGAQAGIRHRLTIKATASSKTMRKR